VAIYNEVLVGRYNRFIQRLLGIKGDAALRQIAGEIQPTMQVDDGLALENRFEIGWRSFVSVTQLAGSVGNAGHVRLRNPPGSGVIAVVEKLYAANAITGAADQALITRGPSPGSSNLTNAPFSGVNRDARQPASGSTLVLSNETSLLGGGAAIGYLNIPANAGFLDFIFYEHQELVIKEDDQITVQSQVTNNQWTVGFMWRERPLEEGERT